LNTPSPDRRDELLDFIVDYVLKHGIADLSLRPLASAVGSSPRVLLYYFDSKEGLISAVIDRLRDRQRVAFSALPHHPGSFAEAARGAWAVMSEPKNEPIFRLFLELYGLALQDRKRYARFLREAVEDWLDYLEKPPLQAGYPRQLARDMATLLLACYRGMILDLCATRDRPRLARALELWIVAFGSLTKQQP
jgi:AcrR family transcriptional regulator